MHVVAALLALVASASAYTVTRPDAVNGWTNSGPQTVAWSRVSTDATNFTIVLTNTNRNVLPQDQILMAEQDGVGQSQTSVNPPSGGWPTGATFRVNLVKSDQELSTIYAQSSEFSIKAANSSTSVPLSTSGPAATVAPPAVTTNTPPSPSTSSGATGSTNPPNPNSAAVAKAATSLVALLGVVTYLAA